MELVNHIAEQYAVRFTSPVSETAQQLEQITAGHAQAHMCSGPVQGAFLQLLSSLLQPNRIVEVGTFTGYSALCLAAGLQTGGRLHTIELREADAQTAMAHYAKAGLQETIVQHIGNALEILPTLAEIWDMAFIDADKTGYIEYYEMILPKLRPGGLLIADNVLFHGQVLAEPVTGKNAIAIDAFNRHVAADTRVRQVMLTVRDGLLLVQKL